MTRSVVGSISAILLCGFLAQPSVAAVKAGGPCSKPKLISVSGGKLYTCVKKGKKLVWNKGEVISKTLSYDSAPNEKNPAPTPTVSDDELAISAKAPTSFNDLVANYKGISYAAWTKVNQTVLKSDSKIGTFDIYTGSNTKPYFDDFKKSASLVSRLFPNHAEPTSNIVIQYMYADLSWAEAKVNELLSKSEIERLTRDENGRLLTSNCILSVPTCNGSKQLTLTNGTNLVLQGVPEEINPRDLAGKESLYGGLLEAHEYLHSLQRIPLLGQNLQRDDYPPVWFVEGSAQWVSNAAVNHGDFKKYRNYFRLDCQSSCRTLKKSDISRILQEATNGSFPSGYDQFLNYNLGSILIESLIAISYPESILAIDKEIAKKVGFATAFKNVYGIEWKEAIPLLVETVYLKLQEL